MGFGRNRSTTKQQNNYESGSRSFDINNKALVKWEASVEDIAEVRKYGSYEFYHNEDIKVVIDMAQ